MAVGREALRALRPDVLCRCGKAFKPRVGGIAQKHCSSRCAALSAYYANHERAKRVQRERRRAAPWRAASVLRSRVRKYGISVEAFEEYLDAQEGACAFCGEQLPKDISRFAIDHDHKTGVVRGLVHKQCNSVIALAERDDNFVGYMAAAS